MLTWTQKLWGMLSKLKAQLEAKSFFSATEVEVGYVSLIRHQFDEINKAKSNFCPNSESPPALTHSQMCRQEFDE